MAQNLLVISILQAESHYSDMSLSVFRRRLKPFLTTQATIHVTVDMADLLHLFEFAPYK